MTYFLQWHTSTLGAFAQLNYGKNLPAEIRVTGDVMVISSAGVIDTHATPLVNGKGIVVGRKGNIGSVTFATSPFWPIDTTFYIVDDPETRDLRFTFYLLRTLPLYSMNADSAVPGLNRDAAHALKILVPPLPEQRRIAKILGDLDDKIELNRKMNETLEQMARALFKSWFVDFDPVRAKMEGRTPSGMDAATAALFPDRLVDSELGPIPEGWEVKALDSIATFLNGLALQKYPASGGQTLRVIKIAQLRSGNTVGADECSSEIPGDYIIEDGDVLFSWSGSLEVELWCGGSGALNQHLFKVTSSGTPKWFYYQWLRHHLPEFREIAADKATTMGHIQRRHLTEALVLLPGAELITAMTNAMQPIHNQLINNNIQSRTLSTLRDTLLPKLVGGEVRVGGQTDRVITARQV
jgi:type I restriction enzyme S subunit